MNQVEDRLQRAAAETRQLATRQRRVSLPTSKSPTSRGWLVLAVAFAVVVAVFGALPILLDTIRDSTPGVTSPLASPGSTTPTSTLAPRLSCSAEGFSATITPQELPRAVASTRATIIEAASICDFDRLEAVGPDLVTSFGGGGAEMFREWEARGDEVILTLLEILQTSPGTIELDDGRILYVWPSAAVYESWDAIPVDALDDLRGIYTSEEMELISDADVYLGWRSVIDSTGRWLNFVAGD